jgi:hypothetical protein
MLILHFAKIALGNYISILNDTDMMAGSFSTTGQLQTDIGTE